MQKSVLAIDIGSSKVVAAIAQQEESSPRLLGHGIAKSHGVKKGAIVNIELASKAISKAVSDAKRISGTDVNRAIVSISGAYTKSIKSTGIVNIPHHEIGIKEINRAMQTALYNANIPNEYDVIHILPFNFKVDDQEFIEDPYGMNAVRMEVECNVIVAQKSSLNNLKKAVKSTGIDIERVIYSGYGAALSVINDDERELGVAVIDIGASTSELVIHSGNSIRHIGFLGVGSHHITSDLSIALNTPLEVAEKIKKEYGNLKEVSKDLIEIPTMQNSEHKEISLEIVHGIINSRIEETFMILSSLVEKSGLKDHIGTGIILTGGLTNLQGLKEAVEPFFDDHAIRVAKPREMDGMFDQLKDPAYAVIMGMVLYDMGAFTEYEIDSNNKLQTYKEELPNKNLNNIKPAQQEEEDEEDFKIEEKNPKIKSQIADFARNDSQSWYNKLIQWAKNLF
ncbi:MAG: cell division protein FtsA [Campylobacterota bacterium]